MNRITRRRFVQALGAGGLTYALGRTSGTVWAQAAGTSGFSDYKALVCVFLFGGNDSGSMVVPRSSAEYAAYARSRQNLAIPLDQLLPVNALNGNVVSYGLHPSMTGIAPLVSITVAIYVVLNVAYSLGLKRVALIDVMVVALGFVLRAVAGAEAINVEISPWLVVCTLLLALFLGFGKRRWELESLGADATSHRAALAGYTIPLLDQLTAVTTAATVVAYSLYTLAPETQAKFGTSQLIWTLPFVLFGVFRYLWLTHGARTSGNPTSALLRDWPIVVTAMSWLGTVLWLIA